MDNATLDIVPGVPELRPGGLLGGKYRILRMIARGGMGVIFAAHHEILGQTVAIKVLLPEHAARPGASARFTNEARAVARLRSEHIAAVMDVGQLENDCAYMVIEYLEGKDLDDLVRHGGPQPVPETVRYVLQALEAVAQAHSLGIIHRDLKPANLFLTQRPDGSSLIKVLDFGISKITALEGDASENLTATHAIMGSPASISPEQLRSSKGVDARTDLWAMGVILYHLLTGRQPFHGESFGELFSAILEKTPPRIGDVRPGVPEALDAIVFRCLERDRDARFANAAELAVALGPFAPADTVSYVERICRTLGVDPSAPVARDLGAAALTSSQPARAPAPSSADVPAPARSLPSSTNGWRDASSESLPRTRMGSLWLPTAAGVAAGALVVGLAVLRLRTTSQAPSPVASAHLVQGAQASVDAAILAASSEPAVVLPAPVAPSTAEPAPVDSVRSVRADAGSAASAARPAPVPRSGATGGAGHPRARTAKPAASARPDDSILLQRN